MAGAAADQSSEYRAPQTLGFDQLTTTEMERGERRGNRGNDTSSEEDLGDPMTNGAAEHPHQASASNPENTLMATMQQMMKQQMEMFNRLMNKTSEKESRTNPERQSKPHENRIELKSFYRMEAFSGLEANYKKWSFNILTTAEAICPGFQEMVKKYMETKDATGWETAYTDYNLEHAELRAKEFQQLLCVLTEGEAQLIIKDCRDGL